MPILLLLLLLLQPMQGNGVGAWKILSDTDMFICCSWGAAAAFPQLQKLDVSSNQLQGSLVKQWVCPATEGAAA